MLPTQLFFFRTNSVAHASVVPALCTLRKGRGTRATRQKRRKDGAPAVIWLPPVHRLDRLIYLEVFVSSRISL